MPDDGKKSEGIDIDTSSGHKVHKAPDDPQKLIVGPAGDIVAKPDDKSKKSS